MSRETHEVRMFTIVIDGHQCHETAGTRTPEEVQHDLTLSGQYKTVRVFEWILTGARSADADKRTGRTSKSFSSRSRLIPE